MNNAYFFEQPDSTSADESARFEAALPGDWRRIIEAEWTHAIPVGVELAEQGWKIHVSAIPEHAQSALTAVAQILVAENTAFKYLSSPERLSARNSKTTPRGHAGKFITAYPSSDSLHRVLDLLDDALQRFSGPYILSDKRWRSAPVYLRYGAFRPLHMETTGGIQVPAIRNASAELVPDERNGFFSTPDWAPVPGFLKTWVNSSSEAESAMPFQVLSAVKFSSAGGTYRGKMLDGEANLIIKEARAHVAHDFLGRDAIQRLNNEVEALKALSGIAAVPEVIWHGMVWENSFAALEFKPGIPLRTWVVANFPAYSMSPAGALSYLRSIHRIGRDLQKALSSIHSRGWAHFDVHGDNVLISENLDVSLIDFECARPANAELVRQTIAASGFRAPGKRTPAQADWHGLRQTLAFMLVPLIQQSELVADYSHQTRMLAASIYPDETNVTSALNDVLADLEQLDDQASDVTAATTFRTDRWELKSLLTPFVTDESLLQATLNGYEDLRPKWTSSSRRFPIHVYGLAKESTGLAYGDAGVMAALVTAANALPKSTHASNPEHWDDLANHLIARGGTSASPGLFSGAVGDLWALAVLGRRADVTRIIESRAAEWLESPGPRIYDGLPGILLALLRLKEAGLVPSSHHAAICESVDAMADAYRRSPESFAPIGKVRSNNGNMPDRLDSGLLYGHLGIGWLFAEARRILADPRYLETVDLALGYELTAYQYDEASKTLQLSEGTRRLPYLATGSAGFGVVLSLLQKESVDPGILESAEYLLKATLPPISVFPGLLAGYAGLALGGAGIRQFLGLPAEDNRSVIRTLSAYAVRSGTGVVFAGDSGIRITADLASGGAGVAFAVAQLAAGRVDLLPPLELPSQPAR
ncbi:MULTISPECIES: class III lanthionine synthetase LanKC [Cryobacterium]|nr:MULTISPECIES: class III lanthionine synthetase LanKC [Cryobacterium]